MDNNLGVDYRDVLDTGPQADYKADYGTLTSVYRLQQPPRKSITGDAYDFRPVKNSIAYNVFFAGIPDALAARSMRASPSSSM